MKQILEFLQSQYQSLTAFLLIALGLFTQSASAAVPTEITDLFTALAVDFAALFAAALVVWAGYKGSMIVWRIGRRLVGMAFS